MIISRGANGNIFGYNYSAHIVLEDGYDQGDIQLHGNYPFANLFEGNIAQFANADIYWGANGHKNTLFRNKLEKSPTLAMEFFDVSRIDGGIRIDKISGTNQYLYVVGNIVQFVNLFGQYFRAQYLPIEAVPSANNNFNARIGYVSSDGGYPAGSDGISYYYSSQPSFLNGYTMPPVGCSYNNGKLPSQSLPAVARYTNGAKTVASPQIQNLYTVTVKNEIGSTVMLTLCRLLIRYWQLYNFVNRTICQYRYLL